jgi:hypothetical protein
VEAEIFDFIGLRKLNITDFNRWAGGILNGTENTMFWKLDAFPSVGGGMETTSVLGPLD